jgi:hypothetical protein
MTWASIVAASKRAWDWLLKHPIAIASALAAAAGAYLVWRSNKNKIATLEDAVAVQGTKTKIAKKETEAKILAERGELELTKAIELETEIAESKRRVVEINEGKKLEDKSDDEIAELFNKSGF